MTQGTIELIILALIFMSLQFWWLRMTIKNGQTLEEGKCDQNISTTKVDELEKDKQALEKLFRS